MKSKALHWFIIGTFVGLYLLVSLISTIHVIEFFELSNARWLAITLAIAFEVGAAASLASLVTLEKMNKGLVFALFITLTLFQSMGNSYYAFVHLKDFNGWVELFGLNEEPLIFQKRVLAIISGGILPLIALGFIKSLVDYIRPDVEELEHQYDGNVVKASVPNGAEFNKPYPLGPTGTEFDESTGEIKIPEEKIPFPIETKEDGDKYTNEIVDTEEKYDIETFDESLKIGEDKTVNSVDESLQIKKPPTKITTAS